MVEDDAVVCARVSFGVDDGGETERNESLVETDWLLLDCPSKEFLRNDAEESDFRSMSSERLRFFKMGFL